VLAVAKRILTTDENFSVTSESQMTLIGFLTFADPPKTGTRESLKMLHELGVSVRIVTGDNALAAAHIAKAIGIGIEGLLTGADVSAMTDGELQNTIETVYVFAETDPIDKERIVEAFSRNGHTVGFLGDGINDTPALHAADVGISVDTAVDVAKQSADLVLLNKDLTVLASGIEEGRRVFVNTLKYVNVTTSANFGNMLSLALASVFLPFLPLLPFQILLLNFLSDIPGMTIATDRVDAEQLRYPHHWDMARVRKFMIVFGLVSTMFDLMTFAILRSVFHADATLLRSGWFIESTLTELAVMLVLRTRRTWWRSRPSNGLLAASIAVAGATLILLYSPLRSNLSLEGPPIRVLAAMMAITALYVVTTETLKKKMPGVLFTHEEPPR
jgi:Mg2+-importing ATPase